MVRLMEKYINNYVWHGVFDKLDTRCTTWMTGTVAGLRQKEGGLAVPNLRAELLALSAVTVSRWGSSATKASLLIGKVLLHIGKKHECAAQKLTMGWTGRRVTGFTAAARSGQQSDVCWGDMGGQAITASMQLRSPDSIRT
ncbi:hypothetical protein CCR75_006369 [Bremia lactucae]|uniref:Uncharacterized protein n=1 Tax=Bremia lactucae TaxID=4779 RepID=A0A976FNI0_BRELC|nr:hypothetical protein CCR75_006369 [Bremia lactucae]